MPRPPLPRPSRRLILTASLLLLLVGGGAVVNVAVAWVLVGAPDSWTPGVSRTVFDSNPWRIVSGREDPRALDAQRSLVRSYVRAPESARSHFRIYRSRGTGWMITDASQLGYWSRTRIDAGWPLHSMMFIMAYSFPADFQHSASLEPPRPLRQAWGWNPAQSFADPRHRLPLTPIPAGFAINTLFYTALLALPLSFFPIRRHLRARRGRCPKCGYDLAGSADPAAPCPECGAGR